MDLLRIIRNFWTVSLDYFLDAHLNAEIKGIKKSDFRQRTLFSQYLVFIFSFDYKIWYCKEKSREKSDYFFEDW